MSSSLFTLLDDVATILDDVAMLTKVASQKTAGVLGDDLALNAQQVAGVVADRELPVVWAVAKGSAKNKLVIVPAALAISAIAAWAIIPILMIGGTFLCFEGFEKIAHKLFHNSPRDKAEDEAHHKAELEALANRAVDMVAFEREKIKGAIRTDIILSAEIIVITLGTVAEASFATQVVVLSAIAAIMTVGVYGFVAGIVKLDDAGLALSRRKSAAAQSFGRGILRAAPYLMKGLSIAGTAAMFLVGGGILVHGIEPLRHLVEQWSTGALGWLVPLVVDALAGMLAGGLAVAVVTLIQRVLRRRRQSATS